MVDFTQPYVPDPELERMLQQAQSGRPQAPGIDEAAVKQQLLDALMRQRTGQSMMIQPYQPHGQAGWGSAIAAIAQPLIGRKMAKNATSELAEALGKQGDLKQYDEQLARSDAELKRIQDMMMERRKAYYQSQFKDDTPDKLKLYKYVASLPEDQRAGAAQMLGLVDVKEADKPKMGTTTIEGKVVPTIDGVPQMDKPLGRSDAALTQEQKQTEKVDEKSSGQRVLAEKMRGFGDLITSPSFASSVGPIDASGPSRFLGGLVNTKDSQTLRAIDRLSGQEVLDLGARVLKGSQTEGEWERVSRTLPSAKDHPEVWYAWYDDALKTLMAGAPELAAQLEPLREKLYTNAEKTGSKWYTQYSPYEPAGSGQMVGKYKVVAVE